MACGAVAELVEDAVAVGLLHLGVDVEARVAQLRDLLCEELHPCSHTQNTANRRKKKTTAAVEVRT